MSFDLAPGVALGQAVDAIEAATAAISKPPAMLGIFQGNAQAFQDSLKSEPYLILAAIITVYIILGVLYESYIHPLTILSTLPSAGVGALLMLMIFKIDLSVIAWSASAADPKSTNERDMMIELRAAAEREGGLHPGPAIARPASAAQFRSPIVVTHHVGPARRATLDAGPRHGLPATPPLRYTMVGGLLVSQALTLFTTPVGLSLSRPGE